MEPNANNVARLEVKNNMISVLGIINFDNVASLWQAGVALFNNLTEAKEIQVDLKAVEQSDSSGIALLTGWVRASQEKNKTIRFMNMPSFMQDILKVCGLEDVLPVSWES